MGYVFVELMTFSRPFTRQVFVKDDGEEGEEEEQ